MTAFRIKQIKNNNNKHSIGLNWTQLSFLCEFFVSNPENFVADKKRKKKREKKEVKTTRTTTATKKLVLIFYVRLLYSFVPIDLQDWPSQIKTTSKNVSAFVQPVRACMCVGVSGVRLGYFCTAWLSLVIFEAFFN